ncbi:MAG: glycosyltransferase family A protein, partial [Pseudomonadota bacterium]
MSEAVTQRDELPGFSVLVPYFNEAEFIEATLDSLCKQSFFPTELILVDNASTDQSTATAKSFLENHRNDQVECRFLQEAVPGKAHAMNRGLMEATSEWLVICDADTFYPPDYLARAASMICTAKATPVALLAVGIS